MRALVSLCVLVSALSTLSWGQLTIPARDLGFVYNGGKPCAFVKIAAYLDLTCPDSQEAFPTLIKVADHFDPDQVELKVHLFSLPYHRNSHTLSKGAHVLSQFKSPKNATVYDWFRVVYTNIDKLTTTATADLTDDQVLDMIADLAVGVSGISRTEFKTKVANGDIDSATRLGWKYGCTRGVYGTPMFTVNDVFAPIDPSWSVTKWVGLITSLLAQNGPHRQTC